LKFTVAVVAVALDAAVRVMLCGVPGVTEMDTGAAVMADGRAEMLTVTVELNEPVAVTEIVSVTGAAGKTVTLFGVTESEKSPVCGMGLADDCADPPPQPTRVMAKNTQRIGRTNEGPPERMGES